MLVHVGTVAEHFHHRGAGQQPPLRPRPARPHALVIRVEKESETGDGKADSPAGAAPARTFQKTTLCGPGATSPGSHPAWTGRHSLPTPAARTGLPCSGGRFDRTSARAAPSAVAEPACGAAGFGGEATVAGPASASWIEVRLLIGSRLLFLLSRFDLGSHSMSRPVRCSPFTRHRELIDLATSAHSMTKSEGQLDLQAAIRIQPYATAIRPSLTHITKRKRTTRIAMNFSGTDGHSKRRRYGRGTHHGGRPARYLDELNGDAPVEPVVRALLGRAVDRLHQLCATLLHRSYPRLTQPPLNLNSDEMLIPPWSNGS